MSDMSTIKSHENTNHHHLGDTFRITQLEQRLGGKNARTIANSFAIRFFDSDISFFFFLCSFVLCFCAFCRF